ncbi:MAG: peptidoglycan D,D-transpeptidase FtsI family protein [Actinomycetota bacterium]
MPFRAHLERGASRIVVAALVATTPACTGGATGPTIPPPDEAVSAFLRSWNELDFKDMASRLDPRGRRRWRSVRLKRVITGALEDGRIRDFEVRRAGPVERDAATALAPYEIEYVSSAAARPPLLEGELELALDEERDGWELSWSKDALWPGVERGKRLDVLSRWPRRAPIVDRAGRVLARGAAPRRRYPFGASAGNAVGHIGVVRSDDLAAAEALLEPGDLVGASGLEAAYDRRLSGSPATRLIVEGRRHEVVAVLGRRRGRPGIPVRTTIDIDVQRAAEQAYGATVGGAVVMDPASGDLLAVVTSSPFDPGSYVGAEDVSPFNRALSGLYPPGSSMKVVTASAALDAGVVTPATTVTGPKDYKGVRNFESGRFGAIDFATALRLSVNTAFAQVAEKLGSRRLTSYARAFGFGRDPDMALGAATSSFPFPEDLYNLMWGSIGQARVLATPLEMASVAATVANRGRRMEPRASFIEAKSGARVMGRRTAGIMTTLMEAVVAGGTGVGAQVAGVTVAGKTGTAEVDVAGVRRNHAWFVCFAPSRAPEVAVALVSEYGGVGGEVAAPLAARILQRVLPLVR